MSAPPSSLGTALADRYRIERELGAGGMATVYLAHDVRHDRAVAVKVLHPELAATLGPDRFLAEIRTTARLQHPHILPLFDSGSVNGVLYYVMPYVEGESLRGRLERERQLPVADALRIATDVADALDYAHKHHIIHRDIKPENILLRDGRPVVADFGISLAVQHAGGARLTQTGLSLGTPAYMAPEQAMGEKAVDHRADIYALGAVTYEMLTGEPPFTGTSAQAIVARMLTEEPRPIVAERRSVPAHVEAAVMTALAKLPADRFGSAAQFAAALATPATSAAPGATVPAPGASTAPRTARLAVRLAFAAAAVLAGVALGWIARARLTAPDPAPVEFDVETGPDYSFGTFGWHSLAIAPDGRWIAYLGRRDQSTRVFTRRLDTRGVREVPGSEGASIVFFSPDAEWVGFIAAGVLKKTSLVSGSTLTVATLGPPSPLDGPWGVENARYAGASWGEDGAVYYAAGTPLALFRVPSGGGTPERLTAPDTAKGDAGHFWPSVLPGGKAVLFASRRVGSAAGGMQLAILRLDTREVKPLSVEGLDPQYADAGAVVYAQSDGSILAQQFDVRALAFTGPPRRVAERTNVAFGALPAFAASRTGTLAYQPGRERQTLVWVDRSGNERELFTVPAAWNPRIAPTGDRIVFARARDSLLTTEDLWIASLTQGSATRLTHEGELGGDGDPAWTPDGRRIVYSSDRAQSGVDLYWIPADGSAPGKRLLERPGQQFMAFVAPSGDRVLFVDRPRGDWDIRAQRLPEGGALEDVVVTPFDESAPSVSPDGRWIAYMSNESGQYEVYVRAFARPGPKMIISTGGGREPVWSPSGREILYRRGRELIAAALRTTEPFAVTARTTLFSAAYLDGSGNRNYDIAPDGQHFVFIRPPRAPRLVVRTNAVVH